MYKTEVISPRSARFVIFALGALLFSDFQQSARVCPKQRFQSEISTFFIFALCVLSFFHRAQHFLVVLSKVHKFVQNRVFRPRSACFVNFALGALLFSDFQQSARVCAKHCFHRENKHVLSFSHWAHHFLAIFSKVHEFVENSVLSPRPGRFAISHWVHHFLVIFSKIHDFVQNSVSSARSARFVIFPPGTTLFSGFEQSAQVCTKQSF